MRFFSVGVAGLEPATSSTRTKRATRLRHTPNELDYTLGRVKLQMAYSASICPADPRTIPSRRQPLAWSPVVPNGYVV